MKFGLSMGRVHWRSAPEVARIAESAGMDSVWVADHLIWPVEYAPNYPYSPEGRPSIPSTVPTMDAWILLTSIAASTQTIRLGTAVYILPLRDPLVTARAVMSLDVISGGRVILGVGAGWLAEEFAYAGRDYHTRGRRMDECIAILTALWTQDTPQFDGEFYHIGPVKFEPKPIQQPRPPILIGGTSEPALRRAARLGDGWLGLSHAPDEAAALVRRLHDYRAEYGRADAPFDLTITGVGAVTVDDVRRYAEAGVTRLVVAPFARTREAREGLERFAETVMAPYARESGQAAAR